jgi:hypothetical protein
MSGLVGVQAQQLCATRCGGHGESQSVETGLRAVLHHNVILPVEAGTPMTFERL